MFDFFLAALVVLRLLGIALVFHSLDFVVAVLLSRRGDFGLRKAGDDMAGSLGIDKNYPKLVLILGELEPLG